MILGQIYFGVMALLSIAGALLTVFARNPIRAAMGLLLLILSIAGLFLALHAEFLAAIQLIVYAGAITVLFLFVIMLLGPDATPPRDNKGQIVRATGSALFAILSAGAMTLAWRASHFPALPGVDHDFGSVGAIGRALFTDDVTPFELSSALLLVAVVGAVAVARGKQGVHNMSASSKSEPS
ncbi:MAG: NADH-quinone oxidoreductase subunit J [Polyangiaceae bacterium]